MPRTKKTIPEPDALTPLEAALVEFVAFMGPEKGTDDGLSSDFDAIEAVLKRRAEGPSLSRQSDKDLALFVITKVKRCRRTRATKWHSMTEKQAVEELLQFLSGVGAAKIASAMGVALSTLYSYSDRSRPNRPGPKRLLQASHLLRVQAEELAKLADAVATTARKASPAVRGRSGETLPVMR
jgi:hypothetical protein